MDDATCVICKSTSNWPIAFQHDPQIDGWRAETGDRRPYSWHLCSCCSNAYPSAQPDLRVLRRVWEANRTAMPADGRSPEAVWQFRRSISRSGAQRSYRMFAPLGGGQPGRILDVACGLGETVKIFTDNGWDAEGIDADPSTSRFHRELGIRARIGQFENFEFGQDYDIVHIAHAIYFITNPMAFLHAVRTRLRPQGIFCIVLANFMANEDLGLPSYAHTFFPTGASMRYALALAGFETMFIKHKSGSIFMAARLASDTGTPRVYPKLTLAGYRTKSLRYALAGRPHLALRRAAKAMIGR